MAQSLNAFFVGIGNMVEEKIPKGKKEFSEFLGDSSKNTIFMKPIDDDEVLNMISKLNPSKACGPNSIPCNILKTRSISLFETSNRSNKYVPFPRLLPNVTKIC